MNLSFHLDAGLSHVIALANCTSMCDPSRDLISTGRGEGGVCHGKNQGRPAGSATRKTTEAPQLVTQHVKKAFLDPAAS